MYKIVIFAKSGRCAIDLLEDGKITHAEYAVHQLMLKNGGWGYASRSRILTWQEWSEITGLSTKWMNKITKSLIDKGLLHKIPQIKGKPVQFILFQEALTPEEQEPYIQYFKDNPMWKRIPNRLNPDGTVLEEDLPDAPTPEQKGPESFGYYKQEVEHRGERYKYDGTIPKRWNGMSWENIYDPDEEVKKLLRENPLDRILDKIG